MSHQARLIREVCRAPAGIAESGPAAIRRARGGGQQRSAVRSDPQPELSIGGRSPDRARRGLVRDDAAQPIATVPGTRHVRRLHRSAARHRRDGFRRALFDAHPSDRTRQSQGSQQFADVAKPDDPGSPYAIGSAEGGHDAVHPELGTLDDFRPAWCAACAEHGMEIALDFAVQCSPDHPWLAQHPEWFRRRPDGSIQYAENPPKKYEDIVNPGPLRRRQTRAFGKRCATWCCSGFAQGVRIFRVDNPHTKPFPFWEWLIREVQSVDPDVIFLSEAFTRPKVMKALAKLGFSASPTPTSPGARARRNCRPI